MNKIITILFLCFFILQAEDEYELGKGVQVASLPLYVGGYFSADYRQSKAATTYRLNDIALIAYGNLDKFSYMAEVEYKDFYTHTKYPDSYSITKDRNLHVERLYFDYTYNENFAVTLGKYNSPIGFWNLLPVNALRQTIFNPMTSDIIFPNYTTGAVVSYSTYRDYGLKIGVIYQNNDDFDDNYNNYKLDQHYGLNVVYEKDDYTLKLDGGYFHQTNAFDDTEFLHYALLSGKYDSEKFQLSTELGYQQGLKEITSLAGYVQGLYRFTEQHIGSVRVESYDDRIAGDVGQLAVFTYTYRPLFPIAIKSEYELNSHDLQDKLMFSLSVIF